MRVAILALIILVAALQCVAAVDPTRILHTLDGNNWSLVNRNGSINMAGTVPGGVYLDLMSNGYLGDPYYRDNEQYYNWVAFDDWTYTKQFATNTLPPSLLNCQSIDLLIEGVDTVATIQFNGVALAEVNNMFRSFRLPIKSLLAQQNTLTISIRSPVLYGKEQEEKYPYVVPLSDGNRTLPHRQFVRKAQSDFGWDWGPSFASSGVWKSVNMVGYNEVDYELMQVQQYHATQMSKAHRHRLQLNKADVLLKINLFVYINPQIPQSSGSLLVQMPELGIRNGTNLTLSSSARDLLGWSVATVWLKVSNPELWWPSGYGAQKLYTLTVDYVGTSDSITSTRKVGFRTSELIREAGPAGQSGLSFTFRINGVDIYIKGANMIPLDAFHNRVTQQDITTVLDALVAANGNAVRVWGGGIYQVDYLYEYCDKVGLLVWQEFAFACAMYPRDDAFLSSVRLEVIEQTRRIASHASTMVFGGNNENEAALTWFQPSRANRDLYVVDYWILYVDTVRAAFLQESGNELPFVVSSPSEGPLSEQPFTQRWGNAQSMDYGDMHYYNYADDCTNVTILPRARFISEFGFQSHPSMYSYAPVTIEKDWWYNSTLMEYRQRHPDGNRELLQQMKMHFRTPTSPSVQQNWNDWIYTSQVVQSLCYRSAFEHWRRIKKESPGRTMGIVYWQLNDIWQAPTWSSLEWQGGRWKMLHYFIKRAYSAVIVTGYIDDSGTVKIYATSDRPSTITATVNIKLVPWNTGRVPFDFDYDFTLHPFDSQIVFQQPANTLYSKTGCTTSSCFFMLSGKGVAGDGNEVDIVGSQIYPVPLKDSEIVPARNITLNDFQQGTDGNTVTFQLQSDQHAAYVWLETEVDGVFNDNGMTILANTAYSLSFRAREAITPKQLQASIKFRSITSTYTS